MGYSKSVTFLFSLVLLACSSDQNKFLEWVDNIEQGKELTQVAAQAPDDFQVNLESIDTLDNGRLWVTVTIKENVLNNQGHYILEFDSKGKFESGFVKK